ncbi:hypothetical protein FOYG_17090 [Fusarium oxysporum NRRL 32931]|uniref:NAD-dependent epimerase/dehydratase domain-containing protein n=1 Tax=Fusarium oxysporum NRRL 32931 TaxID=660029 RepID=W9HHY6_FUSOX|nr:hypothetical protein FOYG_17090 [Fusarium oxysporum NRRL 32931]
MAPKIFLTGATGFIGGDVLYLLSQQHPDWQWTCLVRDSEKAAKVSAKYPNAIMAIGSLDDVDLIEKEAATADIVIHTAFSDEHQPSAEAIAKALAQRQSDRPAYWLHTSGFLSLASESLTTKVFGDRLDKVYDDWDGLNELTSHPDHVPHRHVEKVVLAAGSDVVKTAIISPSVVYGKGRGPDKTTGFPLFGTFAKHGRVFAAGKGENIWHNIHVQDLSEIYLLLAEAAVSGKPAAKWNDEGYYLAENGSYIVKEMLTFAACIGFDKGLLQSPEVAFLSPDEANRILPYAHIMLGANSRGRAFRAKRLLGWSPRNPSFEDEIENAFTREVENQ